MDNFIKQSFSITRVDRARYLPQKKIKNSRMHRLYNVFIYLQNCDKTYVFEDGTVICAKNNDIVFIPSGTDYTVSNDAEGFVYSINFETADKIDSPPFLFKPKNAGVFLDAFKSANKAHIQHFKGFDTKLKIEAYTVIYNIIKESELSYLSKDTLGRIKPAVDFIHSEYMKDNIAVSTLADLCGMSEVTFRSIFTNAMGITPIKYINNLKIESAKDLLSLGTHTVAEAAELSGFHDECYFSRAFKKSTGISPIEYKNTVE